jgi:serralysin
MVLTSSNPLHPAYELLAKGIYGYFGGDATAKLLVTAQLSNLGYSIDKVFDDPTSSFQALGLISKDGTRPPVLVSCGTLDNQDAIDDANPQGVGFNEFTANKDKVKAWVTGIINDRTKNPAGIKVDFTGQSLGGALTQWFASEFPSLLHEAVTFQSPGITKAASNNFICKGGKPSQITHYIVNGDLISLGGEAFLPGTLRVGDYQTPAIDPEKFGDKHVAGILNPSVVLGVTAAVTNELTVKLDDLNRPSFTFSGQDWQDLVGKLKQTNPTLATAANSRSGTERLRVQSGNYNILLSQVAQAVSTPSPLVLDVTQLTTAPTGAQASTKASGANDSNIGLYTMENAGGKMRLTDGTLVPPSDPRYATAAISKALMNTSLIANKTDLDMTDRSIYTPPSILTDIGTGDPLKTGNAVAIGVNSLGANPAKPDDFRNTFGVDDIYGDRNFNNAIFNPSTKV